VCLRDYNGGSWFICLDTYARQWLIRRSCTRARNLQMCVHSRTRSFLPQTSFSAGQLLRFSLISRATRDENAHNGLPWYVADFSSRWDRDFVTSADQRCAFGVETDRLDELVSSDSERRRFSEYFTYSRASFSPAVCRTKFPVLSLQRWLCSFVPSALFFFPELAEFGR
jgi:hypothetical protein